MLKKSLYLIASIAGLAIVAVLGAFLWLIVLNPGDEIKQDNIEKILSMESPVYYSDGQSKIGVFFQEAHRQYVRYDEIPDSFINAIVAAEDNSYFEHFGVDIPGIMRAMAANLKAGKIVQGGSTISQQTAKNLFKRKDRSIKSKLIELLYALRLEYHYSKEKIIEFYANQFYVSGNGHGLGVAAKYYFNKPASELDIVESAFIAGSVKRPNYYNPFIKDNEEKAALARKRAKLRTGYVLSQMHKLGMISAAQYQEYRQQEIGFNRGKMFFPLNTLMDFVKSGLAVPEVEESLAAHGIDNVATSGIKIYTTIDRELQEQAFFALRKELSRLSVRLNGYDHEKVQEDYANLNRAGDRDLRYRAFLMGTVSDIELSDKPVITVSLGKLGGKYNQTGIIDGEGIMPVIDSLVKWEKQRWTEPKQEDMKRFLAGMAVGDRIFTSVRAVDTINNTILLDLEKYPELQGGIITLKDGTIRAMVGGMENHFYNRAVAAKRPMGSVIKPLVYTAALQLGWNSLDGLDNERSLFVYQKQAYFPRPDHHSPHKKVSMSWAGVHSENVATVWLLYHLCDHLTPAQLKDLISNLDLDRREFESYAAYSRRLRDDLGILVDEEQLLRASFRQAVINSEPDLLFSGKNDEFQHLKKMHYGAGFDIFLEEVELLEGPDYEDETRREKKTEAEKKLRRQLLKNNYLHYRRMMQELDYRRASFSGYLQVASVDIPLEVLGSFYLDMQTNTLIYASDPDEEVTWQKLSLDQVKRRMRPLSFSRFRKNFENEFWENIRIEGKVSVATMEMISKNMDNEFTQLSSLPAYSFEVLSTLPDFRVLAGLRYVTELGKALNIRSHLEPVLSFPLGSNVISLLEAAMSYQAVSTGFATISGQDQPLDELAIIDRIENSDGETIFSPERKQVRVVDARTSMAVADILRNIVKFGTGRYANTNVRLHSYDPEIDQQLRQYNLPVPVMGKTGTANRFTNSAFAGVVPGPHPEENGFTTRDGYTVAAYIGFDDNAPMVRNSTHITGSGGALHVWTRMANAIMLEENFGAQIDLVDLAFSVDPITGETGLRLIRPDLYQKNILVDRGNGLPLGTRQINSPGKSDATILTFGTLLPSGELEPTRNYQPFWDN